jgi:hypothetical protein
MIFKFILLAVSLSAANLIYQAVGAHNWAIASERSFFQATAVFITWLSLWLDGQVSS